MPIPDYQTFECSVCKYNDVVIDVNDEDEFRICPECQKKRAKKFLKERGLYEEYKRYKDNQ